MADYPVKWFTSDMQGAPVVSGTGVGSLVTLLDACLIDGFGQVAVTDLTVTNGIAKATVGAGDEPPKYSVIKIAGATPGELNGEHRVLDTGDTWFTFMTNAADGTATGTITSKFAPAPNWEIAFTATNKRVYRSADPAGCRLYYRVDDSTESGDGRRWARLTGYMEMADIDTGTTPMDAEDRGIWKSVSANGTTVKWALIADGRAVYLMLRNVVPYNSGYTYFAPFAFGDMGSYSEADITFAAVVNDTYSTSTSYNAQPDGNRTLAYKGKTYRLISQLPPYTHTTITAVPLAGAGRSGEDGSFGPMNSMLNHKNIIAPMGLPPRGIVPGVYHVAHTGLLSGRSALDLIQGNGDLDGKVFMICPGAGSASSGASGGALIDIIGPWR